MCYRELRISFAFHCVFCGDLVLLLSFTNEHNFLSICYKQHSSCYHVVRLLIHRGGGSCNVRNVVVAIAIILRGRL